MSTYRVVLVGAGGMGQAWAKNLKDHGQIDIAGWVDIKPDAAAAAIEKHQLPPHRPFADVKRRWPKSSPIFWWMSPFPKRITIVTLAALAAGVPVLGEKPMADSMAHARAMVAASEKAGKLYMVSQSRAYDPNIIALTKLVREHIGPLGILNSDFYIGAHFGGFRDEMKSVLLLDMAIHTFDAARQISRAGCRRRLLRGIQPRLELVQGRRLRHRPVRNDRRSALHLSRLVVLAKANKPVGKPCGALTAPRDRPPGMAKPPRAASASSAPKASPINPSRSNPDAPRARRYRRLTARIHPRPADRRNPARRMP